MERSLEVQQLCHCTDEEIEIQKDQMTCSKPSSVSVRTQGGKWSRLLGKYSPHISNIGDAQQRYIDKRISKQTSLLLFL